MIRRGDTVRKTVGKIDYYGQARTTYEPRRPDEHVRVQWAPEYGTWERAEDLTVISYLEAPK